MTKFSDCGGSIRRGVRESAAGTTSLPALLTLWPAFHRYTGQPAGIPQTQAVTWICLTPLPIAADGP